MRLPVSVLMGGQHRSHVVPYATGLYFSDSENLAESFITEAEGYATEGFKAVKKVGLSSCNKQLF